MNLTIDQALQRALTAHKAGQIEEAERHYQAVLQEQPKHPDVNHNLGLIAVSANDIAAALPLFKTALEGQPKKEQFWLSYIDALIKVQRFDTAKKTLEQAKNQGVVGGKLNVLEGKLASINVLKTVGNASPSEEQLNTLAEYYQTGKLGEAEKLAISLTQEFPEDQFAWKALGGVFWQTDRKSEAIKTNQKALQLVPQDDEAHNNLGVMLKELGRLEEAEASYKQAIALKPDSPEAYINLGVTLQELFRLDEAEANFRQAIALKPDSVEAHSHLANTLQGMGRVEEAEASFRRTIALKPHSAAAYSNLGNTLQGLGRLREAETSFTQAIALKPD